VVAAMIPGSSGAGIDSTVVDKAYAGAGAVFWLTPADPRAPSVEAAFADFTRPAAEAFKRHGVRRVVGVCVLGRGTRVASAKSFYSDVCSAGRRRRADRRVQPHADEVADAGDEQRSKRHHAAQPEMAAFRATPWWLRGRRLRRYGSLPGRQFRSCQGHLL
jgi:hypothetical protein